MERKALYPGSFNPFHEGHLSVLKKALDLFDIVYVAPTKNENKKDSFNFEERVVQIKKMTSEFNNVIVIANKDQLTVNFAKSLGASHLIRGLRSKDDLQYELEMYDINKALLNSVETVYFFADEKERKISSSTLKKLNQFRSNNK